MHGVTATKLFSVVNADAGGKVPKWIQTVAAPQVAVQSSNDFTGFIRNMRTSSLNEQYKLNLDHSPINQEFEQAAAKMREYLQANKKQVPKKIKLQLFALF